jgi:hypothetical protein
MKFENPKFSMPETMFPAFDSQCAFLTIISVPMTRLTEMEH